MARMPSTRRLPQVPSPVLVPAPVQALTGKPLAAQAAAPVVVQPTAVALAPAVAPGKGVVVVAPEVDEFEAAAAAARAGGFHESSYELRLGLEVSESAWPDDALPRDWTATR